MHTCSELPPKKQNFLELLGDWWKKLKTIFPPSAAPPFNRPFGSRLVLPIHAIIPVVVQPEISSVQLFLHLLVPHSCAAIVQDGYFHKT